LVFFNAKDKSWQAVAGNGDGVIIINEVTKEQADWLYQKILSFQPDPNKLTLNQLKQTLAFARGELKLGDMYNSTRSFVKTKMTPAVAGEVPRAGGKEIEAYGLKKRDDRDVCHAVYVPGRFAFEGPAGKTLENVSGAWIKDQKVKVEKGKITEYRVIMRISFVLKD
jgi:Dodecin